MTDKKITNEDILVAINEFRKEMKSCYVTIERYQPVERLVYGTIGVMGVLVLTAIIGLVLIRT